MPRREASFDRPVVTSPPRTLLRHRNVGPYADELFGANLVRYPLNAFDDCLRQLGSSVRYKWQQVSLIDFARKQQ